MEMIPDSQFKKKRHSVDATSNRTELINSQHPERQRPRERNPSRPGILPKVLEPLPVRPLVHVHLHDAASRKNENGFSWPTCTHPRSFSLLTPPLSTPSFTDTPPSTTTQKRRSCQTLSARRESPSPIANCWMEENCDIRNECSKHRKPSFFETANHVTTPNRRFCETLSPAAPELVSIARTISNCWSEEKCDITNDCLTQEIAAHRAIATKAKQLAWRTPPYATARPHVQPLEVQTLVVTRSKPGPPDRHGTP